MAKVFVNQQQSILKYPASAADVIRANPNTSFPENPSDALLSSYGLHDVITTQPPEHDSFAQRVVEISPVLNGEQQWEQAWQKLDISPEELPNNCNYRAFWDALIASPIYQVIRQQATTSLEVNTCCTEFIAAMTDAKTGHPNRDALQMCIWLLMSALTLTDEQVAELATLMLTGDMYRVYSLSQP